MFKRCKDITIRLPWDLEWLPGWFKNGCIWSILANLWPTQSTEVNTSSLKNGKKWWSLRAEIFFLRNLRCFQEKRQWTIMSVNQHGKPATKRKRNISPHSMWSPFPLWKWRFLATKLTKVVVQGYKGYEALNFHSSLLCQISVQTDQKPEEIKLLFCKSLLGNVISLLTSPLMRCISSSQSRIWNHLIKN